MGRARGSVTTAQILVPAGRRTGQLDRPRRYRVFLTTPRAADRAGISIYHEPHHQGMRHDRCPHVRAGQIPQGLHTLCRQPRRNNAEYPVRYRSHGYRNELGLATDRQGISRTGRRPVAVAERDQIASLPSSFRRVWRNWRTCRDDAVARRSSNSACPGTLLGEEVQ